jgi:hypothetical protein
VVAPKNSNKTGKKRHTSQGFKYFPGKRRGIIRNHRFDRQTNIQSAAFEAVKIACQLTKSFSVGYATRAATPQLKSIFCTAFARNGNGRKVTVQQRRAPLPASFL